MSRPLRIEYCGAYYHVMNRGRGREVIFRKGGDRKRFLDLMSETCRMWGVRVHAYCLLSNHYHLLLETPQGNLSRVMRHLDGIYTQHFNRIHRTDGSLFRGRYKAILVDAESYLLQLVRYIHLNPVEGNQVDAPEAYPWSSHRSYLGEGKRLEGLVVEEVLSRFHHRKSAAVQRYRQFIREGIDEPTRGLLSAGRWPAVWGQEGFKERVKEVLAKKEDYEIPQFKEERPRPSLVGIEEAVCRRYGIAPHQMVVKRRGHWNEPRNVALYLGRTVGGYPLKQLGERWGGLRYSSASSMIRSVKRAVGKDPAIRNRVHTLERELLNQQT